MKHLNHMWKTSVLAFLLIVLVSACRDNKPQPTPTVVTGDIKAAIEKHIKEQVKQGQGYFKLKFDDKELKLKLVRIHVEYLATLGPRKHFACIDMAGTDGEFYDLDFYLEGVPGNMKVSETMVHKINGRPLYLWKQKKDKSWGRVPVDDASKELLGVITGKDEFDFTYQFTVPKLTGPAQLWMPLPKSDAFQTIKQLSLNTPTKYKILKDVKNGNSIMHLKLGPEQSGKKIEATYHVKRQEKAAYKEAKHAIDKYLKPERLVPVGDNFKEIAQKATKGKKGDLEKARALYDHIIDKMRYMKYGKGWGKGNAVFACNALYGNCTDFHSYFIALARSIGIPARFAIGAAVPSERNEGGVDGYHCWAEFYAEGKWWPVDISEADKYTALSIYYFGHHPANRIEFSTGRDLIVTPGPSNGPINFLAYPILETNNNVSIIKPTFTFKRKAN